jgi:hypothetical protein
MRAYRSEFDDPTTAQRVALAEDQCERIEADLAERFAECGEKRRAVETLEASVPDRQTRSGTASESARAETVRRERERDEAKEKLAELEKLVDELRANAAEAEEIVASVHEEAAEEALVAEETATLKPSYVALSKQIMCAAMSTGMSYETLSAFCEAAGFGHIGKTSFYAFQKVFKVKTMEVYRETTEAALDRARGRKVFVATDAQYDTSRNGYYCVVTVIDQDTSMVLHQSIVTRVDEELLEKHNGSTVMSGAKGIAVLPLFPIFRQFFHFHENPASSVISGTFSRENRFPQKRQKRPKIAKHTKHEPLPKRDAIFATFP